MIRTIKLSVTKAKNAQRIELVRWVRSLYPMMTFKSALKIGDDLNAGNTFELDPTMIYRIKAIDNSPVQILSIEEDDSPPRPSFYFLTDEQAALLQDGADGDEEAAIAFCELFIAGKISFPSPAFA